jgi:uncharacterized protein YbaP (TraB family)
MTPMKEDQGTFCRVRRHGNRTRCRWQAFVLLTCLTCAAHAQSPSQSATSAPTLAPVVVTGVLPGPALWKVSKGNHVMWILGLVTPVPSHMQWKSDEIEKRIAASQEVLQTPGLEVGTYESRPDIPSLNGVKINPYGEMLHHVLPDALYQRWRVQKDRYLYGDLRVEYLRPIFAGRVLYEAALRHMGLVDQLGIEKAVYQFAKHDNVKITDTSYRLVLTDPSDTIDALKHNNMDDQPCLNQILDALEHGLAQTTARANAWATGDIDTLKTILMQTQEDRCLSSISTSSFAQGLALGDVEQRIDRSWIEHAEQALQQNTSTVALLPMYQLFQPHGYLNTLQAEGYTVQAPEE